MNTTHEYLLEALLATMQMEVLGVAQNKAILFITFLFFGPAKGKKRVYLLSVPVFVVKLF